MKRGVTLRYPMRFYGSAADAKVIARARRAVPRLPRDPDTGAGPFCPKNVKGCRPMRDISMDFWNGGCGLAPQEIAALKKAFKGSVVEVAVQPVRCP